jgi:phage gp36-like protein
MAKLKEVKVIFCCDIAGYNLERVDPTELCKWLETQTKAYVGGKDIGILGEVQCTINPKE